MRYLMPHYPCEFEIPDDWLAEAGLRGLTPNAAAYCSSANAVLVPLREIEPPYRLVAHPKDWRGFDRTRMISILNGIVTGSEIEPVPLLEIPQVIYAALTVPTAPAPTVHTITSLEDCVDVAAGLVKLTHCFVQCVPNVHRGTFDAT